MALKLRPAGAADKKEGFHWAFRLVWRPRADSFKRMLGCTQDQCQLSPIPTCTVDLTMAFPRNACRYLASTRGRKDPSALNV